MVFFFVFVCKLKDGRILMFECKGRHLLNADSEEKKALGELWAERSGRAGLFVMPTGKDYATISRVTASA